MAGIGGALRRRQEPVYGPEVAGRRGFSVVSRGGQESEIRAVHRCGQPLAGVSLGMGRHVVGRRPGPSRR